MALTIIPTQNVPLPDDFESEQPTSLDKKVKVVTKTAQLLSEAGAKIPISSQEKKEAAEIFKQFTNPDVTPPLNAETNKALQVPATVQHLFAMLSDYDHQVVQEAVQLRRFVTNKLIEDAGLSDPRHRLKALELLGKITDVGLFTEKSEVTINNRSTQDLLESVRAKIQRLMHPVDVEDVNEVRVNGEVVNLDDELGADEEKPDGSTGS